MMKSDMFAADLGLVPYTGGDGGAGVEVGFAADGQQQPMVADAAQTQGGSSRVLSDAAAQSSSNAMVPAWMQPSPTESAPPQEQDDGSFEARVAQFENFLTDWQSTYYGHSFVGHAQATAMHEDILAAHNPKIFGKSGDDAGVPGFGNVAATQEILKQHPMEM